MNRIVQILLLCISMATWVSSAEEETLEERKRRIARKYLRERAEITYSDEVVPGDTPEDAEVLDSEKYTQYEVDIPKEGFTAAAVRPVPRRRIAPSDEDTNWLLAEPANQDDPYADPFSRADAEEDDEAGAQSDWSTERDTSQDPEYDRESTFPWREYEGTRQTSGRYGSVTNAGSFTRSTLFGDSGSSVFQQQGDQTSNPFLAPGQSRETPYSSAPGAYPPQGQVYGETDPGSSYESGSWRYGSAASPQSPYTTPYEQQSSRRGGVTPYRSAYESQEEQQERYTPYQSPYQIQTEERQAQWGGYSKPQEEYRQPDAYQQWKKRNPYPYDPTSDDTFLKEMMPSTRR